MVQEKATVMIPLSADSMVEQMKKIAWQKGADAIINLAISTKNVSGEVLLGGRGERTSAVVKGTAIRFKD